MNESKEAEKTKKTPDESDPVTFKIRTHESRLHVVRGALVKE
jgi:hypothetical protein